MIEQNIAAEIAGRSLEKETGKSVSFFIILDDI
jgi:hypothetical protein